VTAYILLSFTVAAAFAGWHSIDHPPMAIEAWR
jgi:hypothetical protein